MKAIYLDLDGTIYDLYGVEDWLHMLQREEEEAYSKGDALYDMGILNSLLEQFVNVGFTIGVITWGAMSASKDFNKRTRAVKQIWVKNNLPCVTEFHCVKYGTPKKKVAKIKNAILIDDNEEVRQQWHGITIDANEDIIKELKNLLALFV